MQTTEVDSVAIPLNRYSVVFNDMESHYKSLLDTVPGIVYLLDEKGHFTYLSNSAESVLGYSVNDLIGRHFSYIIYPEDIYTVSRDYILPRFAGVPTGVDKAPKLFDERRSLDRKTSGLNVRIRSHHSESPVTGQAIFEEKIVNCKVNSSGQYFNKNGETHFCGTVGFIFDVSTDNLMISSLESRKRYNALDLLSHAIAHAFSNVFTGIYGNLQLMEMQLKEGNQVAGNIEAIKHSIENAISLIKQVTASLSEPVAKKSANLLCVLVKEVASEFFIKTGHNFECESDDCLWGADVDSDYIGHILRSIFYHISYVAEADSIINGVVSNYEEFSDEFPRLDCKYLKISISFSLKTIFENESCSILDGHKRALGKIASLALNYALLKKVGGLVDVSGDGDGAVVKIFIPSREKLDLSSLEFGAENT